MICFLFYLVFAVLSKNIRNAGKNDKKGREFAYVVGKLSATAWPKKDKKVAPFTAFFNKNDAKRAKQSIKKESCLHIIPIPKTGKKMVVSMSSGETIRHFQFVSDHRNEFAVGRFSSFHIDGVTEIFVHQIDVTAIPG